MSLYQLVIHLKGKHRKCTMEILDISLLGSSKRPSSMSSGGHSGLLDMAPEKEKSPPCGIPASEESNHEETSSETHFDPFKKQKDCILHILILDN